LVKLISILGVTKSCTWSYTRTLRVLIPCSCAYLHSLRKCDFRAISGFKNICRAGFGLVISGSGRVRDSKWGPFTTLVISKLCSQLVL